MKGKFIFLAIFSVLLLSVIFSCTTGGSNASTIYGGSDPKGDYIAVKLDATNHTVTHYNYTTGETNGPYSYSQVTDTVQSMGFSILYKATINASATGTQTKYALFAIYPGAALVYQLFDGDDKASGNPQYALTRQKIPSSDFYEKAYTWMQFTIDADATTDTDMNVGFAAWDSSSNSGKLYGAGYSAKSDFYGGSSNGISNINSGGTVGVDIIDYDSSLVSSYFEQGGTGMDYRITLTGTPSGSFIMDFGPQAGGGSGLAIPQASSKDWNSAYNGTYFVLNYEYDQSADMQTVEPMKCVLDTSTDTTCGYLKVFQSGDNTQTATPFFEGSLIPVADISGANSPGGITAIASQFANVSGCTSATSPVVQSANEAKGSFVADIQEDGGGSTVINITLDPLGKFGGFSGFTQTGSEPCIRFGFLIKDTGYSD